MEKFALFDRAGLCIKPLKTRRHDLDISIIQDLSAYRCGTIGRSLKEVGNRIIQARQKRAAVILMLGGHVLRSGTQKFIIDLMERGYISCIAMNGSGVIHDFELALIGATTENVAKYIKDGQFGLWKETGRINDYINRGYKKAMGMGEAVGQAVAKGSFPCKGISILAAGYRLKVPVTAHVGIGYDIIHEHPNCDGAATGAASYRDFLYFAKAVENLENGVVMNFGSAVMAPEVFLKALSMARNIARQKRRVIKHFTALVCDLYPLPRNFTREPDKENAGYYFRPWKTMLVRTVADGGRSFYVRGRHAETIPALWAAVNAAEARHR
ncbi:MAG: deoxyhypusine synthase family protein [Candidatus Omnitrophota bacterium]|nr:deoxyhypusine synthase family protein [Candidatus Omnitrophota bacterium]